MAEPMKGAARSWGSFLAEIGAFLAAGASAVAIASYFFGPPTSWFNQSPRSFTVTAIVGSDRPVSVADDHLQIWLHEVERDSKQLSTIVEVKLQAPGQADRRERLTLGGGPIVYAGYRLRLSKVEASRQGNMATFFVTKAD